MCQGSRLMMVPVGSVFEKVPPWFLRRNECLHYWVVAEVASQVLG